MLTMMMSQLQPGLRLCKPHTNWAAEVQHSYQCGITAYLCWAAESFGFFFFCSFGPRFDPGFGDMSGMQQGMYVRPTYNSEVSLAQSGCAAN